MALADLIARLERDAEARAVEQEAAAEAEAGALRAEAERFAAQRRARELSTRRLARRARFEGVLADARRKAQAERLAAQHALLTRVFERANALLPEVARTDGYLAQLPAYFAEARRYLEGQRAVVRCHPSLTARLRPCADAEVSFVEDASLSPGLVVSAADDSVFIDNTLTARLRRLEARLSVELISAIAVTP
jgi:vacuolar-type H+-ATPase subunit E/Vma4